VRCRNDGEQARASRRCEDPREQPARVRLLRARPAGPVRASARLIVLTLAGDKICAITRFGDNSLFPHFGLPRTLPD
jgi:hypothetical protein